VGGGIGTEGPERLIPVSIKEPWLHPQIPPPPQYAALTEDVLRSWIPYKGLKAGAIPCTHSLHGGTRFRAISRQAAGIHATLA